MTKKQMLVCLLFTSILLFACDSNEVSTSNLDSTLESEVVENDSMNANENNNDADNNSVRTIEVVFVENDSMITNENSNDTDNNSDHAKVFVVIEKVYGTLMNSEHYEINNSNK